MKECYDEEGYKIINKGKHEIVIFYYVVNDKDDDGDVEFSDIDDEINEINENSGNIDFTNDNKTAYLLYSVKEWEAEGLNIKITS